MESSARLHIVREKGRAAPRLLDAAFAAGPYCPPDCPTASTPRGWTASFPHAVFETRSPSESRPPAGTRGSRSGCRARSHSHSHTLGPRGEDRLPKRSGLNRIPGVLTQRLLRRECRGEESLTTREQGMSQAGAPRHGPGPATQGKLCLADRRGEHPAHGVSRSVARGANSIREGAGTWTRRSTLRLRRAYEPQHKASDHRRELNPKSPPISTAAPR